MDLEQTPIEQILRYLKLHQMDENYYLINKTILHKKEIEAVKKFEKDWYETKIQ